MPSQLLGKTLQVEDLDGPSALLTGTRPGIIKFAPIFRELDRRGWPYLLVHSGQHYSPAMDSVFFHELDLRDPDYKLDVVRHFPLHGEQTAEMLRGIERILLERRPGLLLVGGDSNTHLAGALAARKLHIPIGHVEAGMRSHDWRMPEEHNRVMIDHISEHLFVHDASAATVLEHEGVRGQVHVVGSTIADSVLEHRLLAEQRPTLATLGLEPQHYLLATSHREENVDRPQRIQELLTGLSEASRRQGLPVVFPAHPRTRRRLDEFGLRLLDFPQLRLIEPLGYLDFMALLANARAVLTDSGGVQQEACILDVPCVTLRPSTEWTETIAVGANRLAGEGAMALPEAVDAALAAPRGWTNPFPPGAAAHLVDCLANLGYWPPRSG